MREKQQKKTCVITSDLAENIPFLLQNSCLALLMLISRNPVQTRGIGEKSIFFSLLAGRHQRFKYKYRFTTGPISKPPLYGFQSSTVSLSSSTKRTRLTSTATIESTATLESEGTTKNIMVFLRHIQFHTNINFRLIVQGLLDETKPPPGFFRLLFQGFL